ncbi:hypothetical protein PVL29_016038 [Vitis rotundifolia]|uniref:Disease resistance RPP13-like protein 1 n=1 Tax=Vitis rotundifolia TaxID=103349 RepID=A0AA38ZFC0_VITRO|nr:hypothetical protein PVL29_016038 [Vitis rotundifolia]
MASREVLDFIRGQKLNGSLLKKLKINLLAVQAVLNDAEVKQITDPHVKEWDLLDEISNQDLQRKMDTDPQTSAHQVWNIISNSLNPFADGVESRVEEIIDRLEFLAQQKDVLGLKQGVGEKLFQRWPSTSVVDESGVYGRDGNKEEIIKMLVSDNSSGNEIGVISIVGMGGIGKTTLTQLVYNDESVKKYFDLEAWVCVSEEFDLLRITKTIFEATTSRGFTSDVNDLNFLQVKLKESLNGKKFLLVLDDVWNENYNNWDRLRTPLKVGSNGSKIIVTTHSENVALVMRSVHTHRLGQLPFEDCWWLFAKHAFENGDPSAHPYLEAIGKEIVKKCQGLPLAAKTLGGLLHFKVEAEEWDNILRSEMWDLPSNEILPALRLSYYHLPSHLKQCFAYCSIFPKDYQFQKERLVLLWMAEGFLQQPKSKKRMEEVGDQYFHELLSRSFFQKSSSRNLCFVMHDLVNDLAQLVSGEFCIRLGDGWGHETYEKVRHLSYYRSEYDAFERFETLIEVKCLRTLFTLQSQFLPRSYLSNRILDKLLPKFRCLRVLSLFNYETINLPDSIGNLKHLRYLNVSHSDIKRLPETVCTLYNLQTIILNECRSLHELPSGLKKLINLRHLVVYGSRVKEMPSHIGQLKSLQTLSTFIVGQRSGSRIGELGGLSQIGGKLHISELQNVVSGTDALEANLKNKKYLDELVLEWNSSTDGLQNGVDIINNLQPHKNVTKLTIDFYCGTRLPTWLGDPSLLNMVSLNLRNCKQKVGTEFYGNNSSSVKPFLSLETLIFEKMRQWKEWLPFDGEELPNYLPSLTKLEINGCQQLVASVPRVPTIRELKVVNCREVLLRSPDSFDCLEGLEIEISDISQLKELSHGLRALSILKCVSAESLLEGMMQNNTSLQRLCPDLVSIELPAIKLTHYDILDCKKLKLLMCTLASFQTLILQNCPELLFPVGGLPSTLNSLVVHNCKKLTPQVEWGLHRLASLTDFRISGGCEDLSLPNLRSLDGKGLQLLTSVRNLEINDCAKLQSLTAVGLPSSLSFLKISNCPLLKHQYEFWKGEDWHYISHIPFIVIDDQVL